MINILKSQYKIRLSSWIIERLVHLGAMETIHSDLKLFLFLFLRLLLHYRVVNLLRATVLCNLSTHEQLPGGQTHGFSQILQGLTDLDTLLLDKIVLDILQLDEHLLGINLSLLQLFVSIFLYSFEMREQRYLLMLLENLFSFLDSFCYLVAFDLSFLFLELVCYILDLLSLQIVPLLHQALLLRPQIDDPL